MCNYFCFTATTADPQPMVTSTLDVLTVYSGIYFEYQIPENTFLDLQDGNTRNLTLSLLETNKQVNIYIHLLLYIHL